VPEKQIIILNGKRFAKQAQLLDRGRIDFFLGAADTLKDYLTIYQIPEGNAVTLFPVGEPLVGYLVGAKNMDPSLLMEIREAYKKHP
jgi:ABC-type amino acid transport substrate-binding protein